MNPVCPYVSYPAPVDRELAAAIAKECQVSLVMARLLVRRGCTSSDEARSWLDWNGEMQHDPHTMLHMDAAVEWMMDAYHNSAARVFVHGDYDIDGITSTAIMTRGLRAAGFQVQWVLPSRFGEGYGMSVGAVDSMAEQGATHIVTVDTGITANAEIRHAKERGLKVLVIDHHRPSGDGLPEADTILDPHQPGCSYPNKGLCAAGVSYKFLTALYKRLGRAPQELEPYLDFVTLGTLADLVPLTPENRWMVRKALRNLSQSVWPGIRELCARQLDRQQPVGGQDVLFRLAPLMNAPGRMGLPDKALQLLLTDSPAEAQTLVEQIRYTNEERKRIEAEITTRSLDWVEQRYGRNLPPVLVVDAPDWHLGVIGIVAAKLAQMFGRPAAVLSHQPDGLAHASARAVEGFNWHKALFECRDLFARWGGHANAAGFSLAAPKIEELRERLQKQAVGQQFVPAAGNGKVACDLEISLSELTPGFMDEMRRLEPFGGENPFPVFLARQVQIARLREVRGGHMQIEASQRDSRPFAGIAFAMPGLRQRIEELGPMVDLAFEAAWNVYNGKRTIQLLVKGVGACA